MIILTRQKRKHKSDGNMFLDVINISNELEDSFHFSPVTNEHSGFFVSLSSRNVVRRTKRKDLTATPAKIRKTIRSLFDVALSLERSNGYL